VKLERDIPLDNLWQQTRYSIR